MFLCNFYVVIWWPKMQFWIEACGGATTVVLFWDLTDLFTDKSLRVANMAEKTLDQEWLRGSLFCCFPFHWLFLWFLFPFAVCPFNHWKSDGLCDDINNRKDCGYDGGDCCGGDVVNQYCFDCSCLGNTRNILF